MDGYAVQIDTAIGGALRIDCRKENSEGFEPSGFTDEDGLGSRLKAKGWNDQRVDALLESLSRDGPRTIKFGSGDFDSYAAFRRFWYAGIPKQEERPQLFVCYASEDQKIAAAIAEPLRSVEGIDVFFAPWLSPGDNWVQEIQDAIKRSQFFVILFSPHSVKKDWPRRETDAATIKWVQQHAKIIPVYLNVTMEDVPEFLQPLNPLRIHESEPDATEKAVKEISDVVYGKSKKPSLGPLRTFEDVVEIRDELEIRVRKAPIPAPVISEDSLTTNDKAVLRILFELGIGESAFQVGYEAVEEKAAEKGIDKDVLRESMEILADDTNRLITLHRVLFGGISMIEVSTSAVEFCCRKMVFNYAERKRNVLESLQKGENPDITSAPDVVARSGEDPWLVGHVLRYGEQLGYFKLNPVFMGDPYLNYSVHTFSPRLKRDLQNPKVSI